jgi:hypothetical protein
MPTGHFIRSQIGQRCIVWPIEARYAVNGRGIGIIKCRDSIPDSAGRVAVYFRFRQRMQPSEAGPSRAISNVVGSGTAEPLPPEPAPSTNERARIGSPLKPAALGGSKLDVPGALAPNGALGRSESASAKPLD